MSFYPSLQEKLEQDTAYIINKIMNHPDRHNMIQVLTKGPPKDLGYMWGLQEPNYWTQAEKKAIEFLHVWVLRKDWESSGYAIMFRSLEREIKKVNANVQADGAYCDGSDTAEV